MRNDLVICNGTPKSGTHALLQLVESFGYTKYAFVRALIDETCYARPISYGAESIYLSPSAQRDYSRYTREAPKSIGPEAVAALLDARTPFRRHVVHAHVSWARRDLLKGLRTVTVIRNPRENFISWLRWFGAAKAMDFLAVYRSMSGWQDDFLVTYEDLFAIENVLVLAGALDLDLTVDEARACIGLSRGRSLTWTGDPSDHTRQWTDELQAFWQSSGGPYLEHLYFEARDRAAGRVTEGIRRLAAG